MTTTLTKEALQGLAKPRYEVVQVPRYGKVGIRSQSEVKRARRATELFDDRGQLVPESDSLRRVHKLIDQLMVDENTPMFLESDAGWLGDLDSVSLDPLLDAVAEFNAKEPTDPNASSDTNGT